MKVKNTKMTYKIDKDRLKSKTITDKYNPLSEIRSKKSLEPIMEDNILFAALNSSNNEIIKNQKREQINKILAKFQKSNSKSTSSRKSVDIKSTEYLSRSKSKPIDFKSSAINFKSLSNKIIGDSISNKANTQSKNLPTNLKETINHFDDNLKSTSTLTRRRNEGKYGIVYPAYSASNNDLIYSWEE